jgi:hypothetical protein
MAIKDYIDNPPALFAEYEGYPCTRSIKDACGLTAIDIHSTYRTVGMHGHGLISPVKADILGKVISAYVASPGFKRAWKRIAEEHLK